MAVVEVGGVTEMADQATVPYIVVRVWEQGEGGTKRERFILRAGEGVTFEKFSRSMMDGPDHSLAGEGRLKRWKADGKIIIYSTPGPSHKLCYNLLKEKFPDSHIIWRDG